MSYGLTGTVKELFEVQQVSDNFSKREFVVTTNGDYPQDIIFQCSGKKLDVADNLVKGQKVTVHFNLNGRHWKENKYFNTLAVWKIEAFEVPQEPPGYDDQVPPEDDVPF